MNRSHVQTTRLIDIVRHGSLLLGHELTNDCLSRMVRHLELVDLWNRRINLTALKKLEDSAVFHCLDSLTTLKVIPRREGMQILDVATGAGFPGLVIRTVIEDAYLTLLDSHPGKIVFLKHLVREIGYKRISFLNCGIRQFLKTNNQQLFDLVVSRAFSSDPDFLNDLRHLLRPGGFLLRMAGPASFGTDYSLENFSVSAFWQGFLPYSSSFRRVILYSFLPPPIERP
jgi:16S rRNA (guanine527-N7)-methyltransferase